MIRRVFFIVFAFVTAVHLGVGQEVFNVVYEGVDNTGEESASEDLQELLDDEEVTETYWLFPEGTYKFDSGLVIPPERSGIRFISEGAIIDHTEYRNAAITLEGTEGVTVRGFTFLGGRLYDGSGNSNDAILIRGNSNLVEDCFFKEIGDVRMIYCLDDSTGNRIGDGAGVEIQGSFNRIINNRFYQVDNQQDCGEYGAVNINGGERNIVSGNTFDDLLFSAVSIYGGDYNTISNNTIRINPGPTHRDELYEESMGIYVLNGAEYNIISGNQISMASAEGIVLIAGRDGPVQGNIVSENVVTDCGYAGISLQGDAFEVTRNIVESNQILASYPNPMEFGIVLMFAPKNIIRGNHIRGTPGMMNSGIKNTHSTEKNIFEGNYVEGAVIIGIEARGDYSKYIGNTIDGCGKRDVASMEVSEGSSMVISGNHIIESSGGSLKLYPGIHGTVVSGNKTDKLITFGDDESSTGADIWENQVIKDEPSPYEGEALLLQGMARVETHALAPDASRGFIELWYKSGGIFPHGSLSVQNAFPEGLGGSPPFFIVKSTFDFDFGVIGWRIVK